MENQTTTKQHIFGIGDYLSADDYAVDETVKAKVLTFEGRREYVSKDAMKTAAILRVDAMGIPQDFRFGIKNEKVAKKLGINGYDELIGSTLVMKVKRFQLGSGFVLVDIIKENAGAQKFPQTSGEVPTPTKNATDKQIGLISDVARKAEHGNDYVAYRLETTGKRSLAEFNTVQASDLITDLRDEEKKYLNDAFFRQWLNRQNVETKV